MAKLEIGVGEQTTKSILSSIVAPKIGGKRRKGVKLVRIEK